MRVNLPWHVGIGQTEIRDRAGEVVGTMRTPADAARVVDAVNDHELYVFPRP